jgi:hypothetical protein
VFCLLCHTRYPAGAHVCTRCLARDPAWRPSTDDLRAEHSAAIGAPHATALDVETARTRLLAACDDAYQRAFVQSARAVRTGILGAQSAIRATPAAADVHAWLDDVCAAIAVVRAAVRDDEDGFELGGIATVRNLVEDLRDELSR